MTTVNASPLRPGTNPLHKREEVPRVQTALPSLFSDPVRAAAFRKIRREFDELTGSFGIGNPLMPMPAIDVVRDDKAITVTADLPGMPAEAIDVSVPEGVLRFVGEIS